MGLAPSGESRTNELSVLWLVETGGIAMFHKKGTLTGNFDQAAALIYCDMLPAMPTEYQLLTKHE